MTPYTGIEILHPTTSVLKWGFFKFCSIAMNRFRDFFCTTGIKLFLQIFCGSKIKNVRYVRFENPEMDLTLAQCKVGSGTDNLTYLTFLNIFRDQYPPNVRFFHFLNLRLEKTLHWRILVQKNVRMSTRKNVRFEFGGHYNGREASSLWLSQDSRII